MFSYYGSKSKIAYRYPKPMFDHIIEPFAGSARYSLLYFEKEVTLIDKYDVVCDVWRYLQRASEKDILSLPKLEHGVDIRTLGLDSESLKFVGFMCGVSRGRPSWKVSKFASAHFCEQGRKSPYAKIANQLYKIRHWNVICGDYKNIQNTEATWFIDAPYKIEGTTQYLHTSKSIDFSELADYCKTRLGQVIVCENSSATWLPFVPFGKANGCLHKANEGIWTDYHK